MSLPLALLASNLRPVEARREAEMRKARSMLNLNLDLRLPVPLSTRVLPVSPVPPVSRVSLVA